MRTYDSVGRLTEAKKNGVVTESYSYDANGNRLTSNAINYSYSSEDHVLMAGADTYQFNVDGFLTSKTTSAGLTTYNYSSRGELLSVTKPDGTVITYEHDPFGRRIAKKINGVVTEKYLWANAITLLAVYDGNNNLIMRFNYANGRLPVSMTMGSNTYYLLYDQVGSLRAITDSGGNIIKRIDYDSFGNILLDTNPVFSIPFGFAGGLHDRDTGLIRFGLRDYDPAIGRWAAKDPIDFRGGDESLFNYVGNNPINRRDPMGLLWEYSQSTGQMTHVNDSTGERTPLATGYSGNGEGLNNSDMENMPSVGPIPTGDYDIGDQRDSSNTGAGVMDLTPWSDIDTYGRDDFQIHGDNSRGDNSASRGCIVLPRNARDQINNSDDRHLEVVQ